MNIVACLAEYVWLIKAFWNQPVWCCKSYVLHGYMETFYSWFISLTGQWNKLSHWTGKNVQSEFSSPCQRVDNSYLYLGQFAKCGSVLLDIKFGLYIHTYKILAGMLILKGWVMGWFLDVKVVYMSNSVFSGFTLCKYDVLSVCKMFQDFIRGWKFFCCLVW